MWGRPLSTVVLISVIALVSWPMLGSRGALLLLGLMLFGLLLHHLRNLSLLYRWLQNPQLQTMPLGSGAWEYLSSHMLRMLKRQRETESRLSEALSRFQLAGAALPDAVVILDGTDRIEWCNPKAEDYFGLDNQRDLGQQITYILRQPQFVEHLSSNRAGEPLVLKISRPAGEMVLAVQQVPTATAANSFSAATSPAGNASKRHDAISLPMSRTSCARRSLSSAVSSKHWTTWTCRIQKCRNARSN